MHDAQFYRSSIFIKKKTRERSLDFSNKELFFRTSGRIEQKLLSHFFESLTKLLRMFMVDVSECG